MKARQKIKKNRIEKLKNFEKAGILPYPDKVDERQEIENIISNFKKLEGKKTILAGRIRNMREHGGSTFLDIEDDSGKIQIYLKKNKIGKDSYQFFIQNFDIGDFVLFKGKLFQTKKGEKTVEANDYQILSKSLLPLPEKWHGLQDKEIKFRKRYLDLIMNKEVKKRFEIRSQIIREMRKFLEDEGFVEVETPILQALPGGAAAKPFKTHLNSLDLDLYLRIAPELYLKQLIVGGFEKVFEIGRAFRNEGMDREHNPEFTMCEFYWAYQNWNGLMEFSERLICNLIKKTKGSLKFEYQGKQIDFMLPWTRIKFRDCVLKESGIDISKIKDEKILRKEIEKLGIKTKGEIGYGKLCDLLFKEKVRKKMIQPVFLTEHPIELCPLVKVSQKENINQRFQLIVCGMEIVNAYSELNDPQEQLKRLEKQVEIGKRGDEEAPRKIDKDFIEALEYGMPPCAGWGMGVDRFVALLTDTSHLREIILFPTMKPKEEISNNDGKFKKAKIENQNLGINLKQANKLLNKYIKDKITKLHCVESMAIMKGMAEHFGEDEEKWGIIGLLHDIDWELTKENPSGHTVEAIKILRDDGASDFLIETIVSHCYGNKQCGKNKNKKRNSRIQHCLAAAETLTGLIVASVLVRPDKKLNNLSLESLKKKFKSKNFAANCDREIIKECEKAGLSLDEFLEIGLKSMQKIAGELGL